MFQGTGALAFNATFYLQNNPDVFQAIQNGSFQGSALDHFVQFGQFEGRDPNAFFDTEYYLAENPDVLTAIADPANPSVTSAFQHFVMFGSEEGAVRAPSAQFEGFTEAAYLAANPDVAAAVAAGQFANGFEHFLQFGVNEERPGSGVNVDPGFGETFNLTVGVDTLTGTDGNDTFTAGLSQSIADDGTLVTKNTLQFFDTVNGGEGNDTLVAQIAAGTAVGAPTLTSIENVSLTFQATTTDGVTPITTAASISLANSPDVEAVVINGSTVANTVSGLGDVDELTVSNTKSSTTFADGTAAALALTLTNVVGGTSTAPTAVTTALGTNAALKSLDLQVTNSNVNVTGTTTALTTLNASAEGENTVTLANSGTLTSATVAGAGSLEVTNAFGTLLTKFDASSNTGGVDVEFGASTITATGGAGDDRFDFGTTLTKTDVVNGGAGFDTVVVDAATSGGFASADGAAPLNQLVNIERVEFDGTGPVTLDGDTLSNVAITNLLFNNSAGATVNAAGSARTYEFGTEFGGDATFNMKAGNTTLNVDLLGETGGADAAVNVGDLAVTLASSAPAGTLATINLESQGTLTTAASGVVTGSTFNTVAVIDAVAGSTVNVSGSGNLDIGGSANVVNVNASSFTGLLVIEGSEASAAGTRVDLAAVSASDVITLGSNRSTIQFDDGLDSGVFVTTGTGPTLATTLAVDVINGFTAGANGDILDFTGGTAGVAAYDALNVDQATAVAAADSLALAADLASAATTVGQWTAFAFEGQTYAFFNAEAPTGTDPEAFDAGADVLVQLAGVTDVSALTAANFA